jgi:hypothetical protein
MLVFWTCIFKKIVYNHTIWKDYFLWVENDKNDLRFDCKPLSNLVEMIKKDFDFEEELERFEGSFKWDELVNIYNVDRIYLIFMFFLNIYFYNIIFKIKNPIFELR